MNNLQMEFEERAAILEYEAKIPKEIAESIAMIELNNKYGLGDYVRE